MEPEQPNTANDGEDVEIAAPSAPEGGEVKRFESEDGSDDIKKITADEAHEASVDYETIDTDPPMRETHIKLGNHGTLVFNPITSLIGMAALWGLSAWCMADPEGALKKLLEWRGGSALHLTWFYIGIRPVFVFFIMYIAFRYGDIRLGDQNSKPEFGNMSYFTMLFAAGIGVGIFFYGVSEPLWHQQSHWYANSDYRTQDEIDQFAMNQTLFHWVSTVFCQLFVCMSIEKILLGRSRCDTSQERSLLFQTIVHISLTFSSSPSSPPLLL
jgi:disulfide bond formation protein DsbB